ncbi:hypothetical protein NUSPORA_01948 [Nucleospora cyclopteri]
MFVKNREMYKVKQFLLEKKGMVIPFKKLGIHPKLEITNYMVHKALRTLESKKYVTKYGAWQHAWFFVTPEGDKMLREEVGLPEEKREEEIEVKA